MISTQRIRETRRRRREPLPELTVPAHFRCPISLDLMKDPVTLSTGITYDRQSIETWLDAGCRTCPVTNQALTCLEVIPNHTIRRSIQDWCVANRSFGMERIVTPKAPITSSEVSEILRDLADAAQRNYHSRCAHLVKKVNSLCKESERNTRQMAAGGAASVLALAFDALASNSSPIQSPSLENYVIELEEILEALTRVVHPLSLEGAGYLGSPPSLRALLQLSKCGSLEGRKNAVTAMKELISVDRGHADALSQAEGFAEALVEIIREPICPATTKSSLLIIFYLISNEKRASRFADAGLVSLLLEMLVDSEKSISEKALAVLDRIFSCEAGREKAYGNALTVPVLVKKMFRVSELATEFAVSALWRLCKNEAGGGGGILVEGLQVGAFQKVLLLLQVGRSEKTKEKATEILKMMNVHRGRGECIDSMDFKQLKRSF